MRSIPSAILVVSLVVVGLAAPAAAGKGDLKTCPTTNHVGDVSVKGTCIIGAGITVDGDVKVSNGTLRVHGTVTGNVTQKDKKGRRGHLYVQGNGYVGGYAMESGQGRLQLQDNARVGGDVRETDDGHLNVFDNSWVGGDVSSPREAAADDEPGKSFCTIHATATVVGERKEACVPGYYDL